MKRRTTLLIILLTIALETTGCSPTVESPPTPTAAESSELVQPTTVQQSPTPTLRITEAPTGTAFIPPTETPAPPIWTSLAPGIEERLVPYLEPDRQVLNYLYAIRLDPSRVEFRVHYQEGQAQTIEEWQAATGAAVVVNGGFFSGRYTPVGRIVSDGIMFGFPLNYGEDTIGVAGLFAVLDGETALYALGRGDYSPRGMRFDEALESYPILLLPGRQPTYPRETNERARRTVIGIDDQQRTIILVADLPLFTLHTLSGWLAESDLNFDTALNLDGGRSTGMVTAVPGGRTIPAYVPLPIVLAIYPR